MTNNSPLLDALRKSDFAKARELMESGETIPDGVAEWDLRQVYQNIIKAKAFDILDAQVKKGRVVTDVYEYDSLQYSIYELLFKNLPVDAESLRYLHDFITRSDNVNDEVAGKTLLSYALEVWANPAIVQTLIDAGLRTDFKNTAEDNLINQAVRINMIPKPVQQAYVEMFIRAGVDVNEPNVERKAAIHLAVESDKKHLLDTLLQHGARPNEQDWKGNSAIYVAVAHKLDGEMYQKLAAAEQPDFAQRNNENQTILSEYLRMMSGSEREIALLHQLIDDGADLEMTAPYYSEAYSAWDWIAQKNLETLQTVLNKTGRDVNLQDDAGNTLLHKLCARDCNHSQEAAKLIYKKVKLLLEMGADPSITNGKEETAFTLASADNLKTKTVELLLKAKDKL